MNAPFRTEPSPAPRVQLEPDVSKITAAIAFLIGEADRRGLTLTQYDIVKALFFADRSHLNNFGRPVTYDNYVAMRHGPVPSLAYDMLKVNETMLRKFKVDAPFPWKREQADHLGLGCFRFSQSSLDNVDRTLSVSDMDALANSLSTVKGLTFGQIRELTHGDLAYKEAWALVGEAKSIPMSLGLLFDLPDFEAAEDVKNISQQRSENLSSNDDLESYLKQLENGEHSELP